MSKYHFNEIEAKWQKYWAEHQTFKARNPGSPQSKGNSDANSSPFGGGREGAFYVLDMFPYPSGAGLHVGHPLGYIASDIYARYKRHKGFNVLHPMGYDSFGLPAEQYAIQTGQHPANTTRINIEGCLDVKGEILPQYVNADGSIKDEALIEKNLPTNIKNDNYQQNVIKGYRRQLDRIGFSFDWSREVRTSDPEYYKWTQWIFIQLFESWYDTDADKARPIEDLISIFSIEGSSKVKAVCDDDVKAFSAEDWNSFSEEKKQETLLKYRLTYLAETEVNWCPALGTVLANDEIVNGVSERGGHPVIRKKMLQWSMRITAYAQRLLDGLDKIDWPQPLKDSQANWIGKSTGAEVEFKVLPLAPSKGGGITPPFKGRGAESAGYLTGNPAIIGTLLARAKEMRKNPTKAEALLWKELRTKKMGYKFRQQHPIDNYIVDFVCLSKSLIIEIDGEIHQYQLEKDDERELLLKEKKGFKVLRFTNDEVLNNLQNVVTKIEAILKVLPFGEDLGGDFSEVHSKQSEILPLGARGTISVFTTRPDTIFGVSFMVLAPEHELVSQITTADKKAAVEAYIEKTAKRSERERMADVKTITGVFTGAFAEHPFTQEPLPIWVADYVLAGYGTGAVMSVPAGDQRDHDFAKHFDLPIPNVFKNVDISETAHSDKEGTVLANSGFLNDLSYKEAVKKAIEELEKMNQGKGKTNYRLRDAVFSRQRYWGEPFPVYYKNGLPYTIPTEYLPLRLPEVEKYLPTEDGQPPLGNANAWFWNTKTNRVVSPPLEGSGEDSYPLELNTMPGWAGSSWYFFRYMEDKKRDEVFASKEALNYWQNVDLYIGGSEHATGHLLYARFWTKFLKDRGFVGVDEPFKKLINQGMILGESAFVYRLSAQITEILKFDNMLGIHGMINQGFKKVDFEKQIILTYNSLRKRKGINVGANNLRYLFDVFPEDEDDFSKLVKESISSNDKDILHNKEKYGLYYILEPIHSDVSLVNIHGELNIEAFKNSRPEYKDAIFISEDGIEIKNNNEKYIVGREVEKMSKSKYNVVNPDDICEQYGADTLRLYEMFLGPLEQAKPWSTAGITGVHGFLKKLWKLYHSGPDESFYVTNSPPSEGPGEAFKILHKTIKKVEEDIENFSFNTSVSTFMIAVNELTALKCNTREILEPLAILISPYAPHIAEELWSKLGPRSLGAESISTAPFPKFDGKYLVENTKEYPVSFNGKTRFTLELPLTLSKEEIETAVMSHEKTAHYLEGRTPKKIIIVPGKIVNIVG